MSITDNFSRICSLAIGWRCYIGRNRSIARANCTCSVLLMPARRHVKIENCGQNRRASANDERANFWDTGTVSLRLSNDTVKQYMLDTMILQVVKMYTWEAPFDSLVSKVRALEMVLIRCASFLRGFYLSVMIFSERVALFLTLIVFVLLGNSLDAEVTFVAATFFKILQITCAICFPQGIILAGEASITLERLTVSYIVLA